MGRTGNLVAFLLSDLAKFFATTPIVGQNLVLVLGQFHPTYVLSGLKSFPTGS